MKTTTTEVDNTIERAGEAGGAPPAYSATTAAPGKKYGWLSRLHDKPTGIPYGIALALGALLIYRGTDWIKTIDLAHFAMR